MDWTTPDQLQATPHMGAEHWERWYRWLLPQYDARVLEFGAGGSTCYATARQQGVQRHWVAVEHDKAWYAALWRWMQDYHSPARLYFAPGIAEYTDPPVEPQSYHIVLVDGTHRNAVLAKAQRWMRPDGHLVLHDAERPYVIPDFLEETHRSTDSTWAVNPNAELAIYRLRA